LPDLLIPSRLALEYKRRVVTELAKVLQALKHMPLARCALAHSFACFLCRTGLCKLVVQVFLHVGQFAVIVLDDLWREVVQNVLL
jgi:hypothetical protein